jgi:WD40 repeat protein
MAECPLQIYCAALVFAPSQSLVRQRFLVEVPPWISSIPAARKDWSGKILVIETTPSVTDDDIYIGDRCHEALVFSHDGQTLALGSDSRGISLWDPTTGASRGIIAQPGGGAFGSMAFSPDERFLAYVFLDREFLFVGLWDVALQAVRSVNQYERDSILIGLRFSPTSELFAIGSHSGLVRLFDPITSSVRNMKAKSGLLAMSFSPSGRFLAVASWGGIHVEDIKVGKTVVIRSRDIRSALFSPCDDLLAHSVGSKVRFWCPDEGGVPPAPTGHADDIMDLLFSPNGKLLASVCSLQCSLWDLASGAHLYCLKHTDEGISPLLFSPGRRET